MKTGVFAITKKNPIIQYERVSGLPTDTRVLL